jgi:hypothetical protein
MELNGTKWNLNYASIENAKKFRVIGSEILGEGEKCAVVIFVSL